MGTVTNPKDRSDDSDSRAHSQVRVTPSLERMWEARRSKVHMWGHQNSGLPPHLYLPNRGQEPTWLCREGSRCQRNTEEPEKSRNSLSTHRHHSTSNFPLHNLTMRSWKAGCRAMVSSISRYVHSGHVCIVTGAHTYT